MSLITGIFNSEKYEILHVVNRDLSEEECTKLKNKYLADLVIKDFKNGITYTIALSKIKDAEIVGETKL